jgi:hypothetical protein
LKKQMEAGKKKAEQAALPGLGAPLK